MICELFHPNKYTKWYLSIIECAKSRIVPEIYLEEHHIIPKSIEANNETIMLTAKEHFICHLLLTKMCIHKKHHFKMLNAFQMMANCHASNQQRYYNAAAYALVKKQIAAAKSEMYEGENNPFYGKKHSPETMEKMAQNRPDMNGRNNPNYGNKWSEERKQKMSEQKTGKKHSTPSPLRGRKIDEKTREKISLAMMGRITSEETRIKLSESKLGSKNPNYGKPISDKVKEKLSLVLSGKIRDDSTKQFMAIQKAKAICEKMYLYYDTISTENIIEAKKKGLVANSSPTFQRIIVVLGSIPDKELSTGRKNISSDTGNNLAFL